MVQDGLKGAVGLLKQRLTFGLFGGDDVRQAATLSNGIRLYTGAILEEARASEAAKEKTENLAKARQLTSEIAKIEAAETTASLQEQKRVQGEHNKVLGDAQRAIESSLDPLERRRIKIEEIDGWLRREMITQEEANNLTFATATQINTMAESLEGQRIRLQEGEKAWMRYKDTIAGATPSEVEQLEAMRESGDAFQQQLDSISKTERALEAMKTPAQKYAESV